MMDQMISQFIKPMLKLDENMSGNQIAMKTGVDFEKANALTEEQRGAVLAILDPGRNERNEGMFKVMTPMLMEVGKALEGPMREGLARAYARKFAPDQLIAINGFFATPTGSAFAAESFAMQADPEVMSATFQAIPVLMTKLMGSAGDFEAKMKELPQERKLAELSDGELARLAKILDMSVDVLKENGASMATTDISLDSMMTADAARLTLRAQQSMPPWALIPMLAAWKRCIDNLVWQDAQDDPGRAWRPVGPDAVDQDAGGRKTSETIAALDRRRRRPSHRRYL